MLLDVGNQMRCAGKMKTYKAIHQQNSRLRL